MATHAVDACPSLVLTEGGPGATLLRRLRVAPLGQGDRGAALVLAGIAWVPLLVLSAIEGLARGGATIPFLYDIAAHVRFLLAVPVLIVADMPIGIRLREVTAHFVTAGLVREQDHARFGEMIADAERFRDSRVADFVVLAAAYATTFVVLTGAPTQAGSTWYAPTHVGPSAGGYWYAAVSLPIFQFLLYRWSYRMVVWTRFLRRVASLDLHLSPVHPDGAGGLGFLGKGCVPFGILVFALSAVVASAIASRVLFAGARLQDFQFSYVALLVILLAVFAGPLLVFTPTLLELKRRGHFRYGAFATRYTQLFGRKWVTGEDATDESPLGSADLQSLADLGSTFERVEKMRVVPIGLRDFVALAIPGIAPAIPLVATVMPVADIAKRLLRLIM